MVHHEAGEPGGDVVDTICAVATPPGRGGVAVIRLSGPEAHGIAESLVGALPPARQAAFRTFRDSKGDTLDAGIVLRFDAPASYTGEDTVELHGHGSPAATREILLALEAAGARPAGPGEFSERAFLNGRLDLTQAEAVRALIEAESEAARRAAVRSLEGRFGSEVAGIAERVEQARALLEATLDFPEDEETQEVTGLPERLRELQKGVEAVRKRAESGARLGGGLRMALVGQPNVGKSSLLNALSEEESAIVSEMAGTTRDVVKETMPWGGRDIVVADTAGLREGPEVGAVEREGARRAREQAGQADILLVVVDAGSGLGEAERELLGAEAGRLDVVVFNRIDETGMASGWLSAADGRSGYPEARVSATRGEGIEALRRGVEALLEGEGSGEAWAARQWHVASLDQAAEQLERAVSALEVVGDQGLAAEHLREAHEALGEITGRVSHEALLDRIFSEFCIGK